MKYLLLIGLLATPILAFAQGVTIGAASAPDPSAVLDIRSTTQGVLPARLTEAARLAMGTGSVPAPAAGLLVYQTDGTSPGFYYASSATTWVRLTDGTTADSRYIQNQTTIAQTGGFRVSGAGTVGGALTVGTAATIGGAATVGGGITAGSNVQIPVANNYTYASAKSYSVMYGSTDFQTESYSVNYPKRTLTDNSTYDEVTGYNSTSTVLRVPLHLPQGAKLVSFVLYYFDDYSSNLTVTLNSTTMNAASGATTTILGTFTSSINSGYSSATVALSGTIDNTTKAYYLRAILPDYYDQTISGVKVNYTVTQTE